MATFIIVTGQKNKKGSVQGITQKTLGATNVIMRKNFGRSKTSLKKNANRWRMSEVSSRWRITDETLQSQWRSKAGTLFFKNKYGETVRLSQKNLFVKSQAVHKSFGSGFVNPSIVTTTILAFSMTVLYDSFSSKNVVIQINQSQNLLQYYQLRMLVFNGATQIFEVSKSKILNVLASATIISQSQLYDYFELITPTAQIGYTCAVYLTPVNPGGITGTQQSISFILT